MTKCNIKDKIKSIIIKMKYIANCDKDVELAEVLNVDKSLFASWKNNKKEIPIDYLIDFCDLYDVSLDYILRTKNIPRVKDLLIPISLEYDSDHTTGYIYFPFNAPSIDSPIQNPHAYYNNSIENPRTIGKKDITIIDIDDKLPDSDPKLFLFKAGDSYFMRMLCTTFDPCMYRVSAESEHIMHEDILKGSIEIIGKLRGVIKWRY